MSETLTTGESLTITDSIYRDSKKLYKWCQKCNKVTEHLKLPDYLKWPFRFVEVCNATEHTVKFQHYEESNE